MDNESYPAWLETPISLMYEDKRGKVLLPQFLKNINALLMKVMLGEIKRLMINVPFQHGKTTLCTVYYLAWCLLNNPQWRILLGAHETSYAVARGADVREVVRDWGPLVGVKLREGAQAKDEWVLEGGGGLVSRGMKGSVQGRPADGFLIEDPYKDWEQAASASCNEARWKWYSEVVYPKLGQRAWVVMVTTRWAKGDMCGRILDAASQTGEKWEVVKYKAIAGRDDPLGREEGEALFPERIPLHQLRIMEKQTPTRFRISYQQEDGVEEGRWFKVRDGDTRWLWPRYRDLGSGAWSVERRMVGGEIERRKIWLRRDCMVMVILDWAYGKKEWSDYSALGAFALTPACELLVLEVIQHRWGINELAPALAKFCAKYKPSLCGSETGHPTLRDQCRAFREIPEMRWFNYKGRRGGTLDKLTRAMEAIRMGDNGRILVPERNPEWLEDYVMELMSFTGERGSKEEDHRVDVTSYAAEMAREFRGASPARGSAGPCVLTVGKCDF